MLLPYLFSSTVTVEVLRLMSWAISGGVSFFCFVSLSYFVFGQSINSDPYVTSRARIFLAGIVGSLFFGWLGLSTILVLAALIVGGVYIILKGIRLAF